MATNSKRAVWIGLSVAGMLLGTAIAVDNFRADNRNREMMATAQFSRDDWRLYTQEYMWLGILVACGSVGVLIGLISLTSGQKQ